MATKALSGYSEVIKFQGSMRLSTRFELSDRKKLRATTSDNNKVIDPSSFGKNMGMVSDRFWQIFTCQSYLKQNNHRNGHKRVSCWSNTDGCFLLTIMFSLSTKVVPKLSLHPERLLWTKVPLVGTVLLAIGSQLGCPCIILQWTASQRMDVQSRTPVWWWNRDYGAIEISQDEDRRRRL